MSAHPRFRGIELSETERQTLQQIAAQSSGRSPEARRAQMLLLLDEGRGVSEIRQQLSCSPQTIAVWRRRFERTGLAGLSRPIPR